MRPFKKNTGKTLVDTYPKQAENEVVPSSSLVEVEFDVEVEVGLEVEVEVEAEVGVEVEVQLKCSYIKLG